MTLLRRYRGMHGAREYLAKTRNTIGSENSPTTDGGGYYNEQMSPETFAQRVIDDVAEQGDEALRALSVAIDGVHLDAFEVPASAIESSVESLQSNELEAMQTAAERVAEFQARNLPRQWFDDERGYGEIVRPIQTVGCYVPSGSAPLASTVIMTVVPALAAGVPNVFVSSPANESGMPDPAVLAACKISGAHRVFALGGVAAIAAFACGTDSIPKVDFICGPGNVWVTAAKKAVYGKVGLDGVYGPTETMVIVDEAASPAFAAADLIAQAEHDTMARPILVSSSESVADEVERHVNEQLSGLPRSGFATAAFNNNGAAIVASGIDEALEVADLIAPEHLCLAVEDAGDAVDNVNGAGGVFAGEWSAEVMADYIAGPSHVMPTDGSAKWSSTLSARDFVRVIPVVNFTQQQFLELSSGATALAELETLHGHAEAASLRRRAALGE